MKKGIQILFCTAVIFAVIRITINLGLAACLSEVPAGTFGVELLELHCYSQLIGQPETTTIYLRNPNNATVTFVATPTCGNESVDDEAMSLTLGPFERTTAVKDTYCTNSMPLGIRISR